MSIDNFVVDTQTTINNPQIQSVNISTPNKKAKQSNKTTVEQQIQEYQRSRTLSDILFGKYEKLDGWDSIWNTPTISKDNGGVKSIYISNNSFLKMVEYFTVEGQTVCDIFAPADRRDVLTDMTNATFISNEEKVINQLQTVYEKLKKSPFHSVGEINLSSYENLSGMYNLITASLPSFKDIPTKMQQPFNGNPQQYIALLANIVTNLANHLADDGCMVLLLKDFHDGKYFPILTLVPYIIKQSGCIWTYTVIVKSGTPLPESLWIKFYQEKRFKVSHAYMVGLRKVR